MLNKPSNATWVGKAVLDGAGATSDFAAPDPLMQQHPLPDALHPDAATHALIGERFARAAFGPTGCLAPRPAAARSR